MARRDLPYLPLYIQDFLTDEKLVECSAESTGVYIRLMCIMHKSQAYGTVELKAKDIVSEDTIGNFAAKLAKQMPYDAGTIRRSLDELIDEGVLTLDRDILFQKRMVRDDEVSDARSVAGKKGARKTNSKKNTDAPEKPKSHPVDADTANKAETPPDGEESPDGQMVASGEPKKAKGKKTTPDKIAYAEFVKMTEEEHAKLVAEYGEEKTRRMIEILDNYKGANGKTYKSDYRAILNWVVQRVDDERTQRGAQRHGFNERGGNNGGNGFTPSSGFRQG